jgi:restriction endonuclease S subunit
LTGFREITGGRLDPFYQQRYFIEIIQSLNKSKYEVINFRHLINNLENGVEIRNYITDGGLRYLRVTDLGKNELNDNSMRYVETQKIPERIKLNNKCILISRSGSLGLINVFESKLADAILSSHIFKVELNTKLVDPSYIEAYLRSKIGQSEIFRNNNGGVIPEINQDALKSIHVIVPPLDKQQKIASQISIIRHQAQSLQKEAIQKLLQAKEEIEKMILG